MSLELLLLAHHAPLLASLGGAKALRLVSVRRPLSGDVAVRQAALFVQQSNVRGIEWCKKSAHYLDLGYNVIHNKFSMISAG